MAEPTPWPLANVNRKIPRPQRIEHYVRDPYNFPWTTVSHGTNPALRITATGPYSAGAPPPTDVQTVDYVEIIDNGTLRNPVYGNNLGEPTPPGA